jgi:hypothetical protein
MEKLGVKNRYESKPKFAHQFIKTAGGRGSKKAGVVPRSWARSEFGLPEPFSVCYDRSQIMDFGL